MRIAFAISSFGIALSLTACTPADLPPLATVETVQLDRYAGRWYEIAKYPTSFQRGCDNVTAEYTLRDDGRVTVVNRCIEERDRSQTRSIEGTARVVDTETNAKLAVGFGLFEGSYWIIMLGKEYEYAVVGEPSRRFLWILSRTPTLDSAIYDAILAELPAMGYDPAKLVRTNQELSIQP